MVTKHYSVEILSAALGNTKTAPAICTRALDELRKIKQQIDELWIPFDVLQVREQESGALICSYDYQANEETMYPSCDVAPRSFRTEWDRTLRAIRREMARRAACELIHRIRVDEDNGGCWQIEDLRHEGLHRGATKTHPGYCSKNLTLGQSLEPYSGAYGAGIKVNLPRYDTNNYHYVEYWLYDLEAVVPDGT